MNKYRCVIQCTFKDRREGVPVIDAKVQATAIMYGQNEDEVRSLLVKGVAFYLPELAGKTLFNPVVISVTKVKLSVPCTKRIKGEL